MKFLVSNPGAIHCLTDTLILWIFILLLADRFCHRRRLRLR
uniref:Chorion gene s15 protein n=1 Tax=Drosophila silvestris TaxID=47010 RepID=Q6LBQ4_DROSL|nr:chorion gene s15 [Drosophila silvestris]